MYAFLGTCLLVGTSVWIAPTLRSPRQAAADAAPPSPSVVTAVAERRVLAEPLVLRGSVVAGASVAILPPVGAAGPTAVVTKVEMKSGDVVKSGTVLLEQSGAPIIGLTLPFPLYRDLVGGASGPDVSAVQQAIRALGYATSTSGTVDAATQSALTKLFKARGYAAPVPDGAAAALKQAQATRDAAVAAGSSLAEADAALRVAQLAAGPCLPRSWVVRLTKPEHKVTTVTATVGAVLAADTAIMTVDGGVPTISVLATKEQVTLIQVGQKATVTDEVSGAVSEVAVAAVGTEASTDKGSGLVGFQVTLSFSGTPFNAPDRTVRVDLTSSQTSHEVLAVPVSAVYSRPDGSTFVTVLLPGDKQTDISVTSGQVAGGWVEITVVAGPAIEPGARVLVGTK